MKRLSKTVKTSLNCFRLIRSCLSFKTAHLYLHAMVLSHLSYCITAWGQATDSATRPLFSLYRQALKILDQEPQKWHHFLFVCLFVCLFIYYHCKIIEKYNLLTFSNYIKFSFLKVVFKCLNGLAPQAMSQIFKKTDNSRTMCSKVGLLFQQTLI